MAKRINQDRDEGHYGNRPALELADMRADVRSLITDNHGDLRWFMARDLGKELLPPLAASTVMNFATGETRNPDTTWTVRVLMEHIHGKPKRLWYLDADYEPPKRARGVPVE